MTDEQYQLLCAAILETVSETHTAYSGRIEDLAELVLEKWPGPFSTDEVLESIGFLTKINIAEKSSFLRTTLVAINHPVAMRRLQNGSGMPSHPMRIAPLLHEYAKFGRPWLDAVWSETMISQIDAQVPKATQEDGATPQPPVDSATWTGLPQAFVLTEERRRSLVRALDAAEEALPQSPATQHDQAQARAYIVAAKALLEAPEPDPKLAWELIGRANSLAGIASLLVSILALFMN